MSCNPAFLALYGYAEEEVIGHHLDDLITTPETRAEAVQYTAQALDHQAVRAIAQRRRRDGSLVDVEVLGVPVVVDGVLVGMMGLYHDITELLKARREAEAAEFRQEPVPRQHEPRAAHPAQCHHRLRRDARGGGRRRQTMASTCPI